MRTVLIYKTYIIGVQSNHQTWCISQILFGLQNYRFYTLKMEI